MTSSKTQTGVHMHETRNDTKSNAKKVSLDTLQARLADGIDLSLTIKQAHWNLKGPQFIGIHLMLDGFRDEMDDYNDKVAERIIQLGGTAKVPFRPWTRRRSSRPITLDTTRSPIIWRR